MLGRKNRSTKFDVLSAWTQNGVDKIDIRKSIIPRIERVTKRVPNLPDRTGHESCPKSLSQISRIERVTNRVSNLTDRTGQLAAEAFAALRCTTQTY